MELSDSQRKRKVRGSSLEFEFSVCESLEVLVCRSPSLQLQQKSSVCFLPIAAALKTATFTSRALSHPF